MSAPELDPLSIKDDDAQASPTPPAPPSERRSTGQPKYGSSCTGCRKRKQRCDAKTPACSRCSRLKEVCVYESNVRNLAPPPHSGPLLTQTFDFLRSLTDPTSGPPEFALRPLIAQYLEDTPLPNFAGSDALIKSGESLSGHDEDTPSAQVTSEVDELIMHMSVADDGQNGHFGVTSLFWQSPPDSVVERLRRKEQSERQSRSGRSPEDGTVAGYGRTGHFPLTTDAGSDGYSDEQDAGILKSNASMIGGWETLAISKLELETGVANAEMIFHLLKTYFSWQYGSHCVVYRPVFIRDMALDGPCFNEFLLNVICAHATRYSDVHTGTHPNNASHEAQYLARAKSLLAEEIDKYPDYPGDVTSRSARMCLRELISRMDVHWASHTACASLTYSMAFRAMRDMGIHLDCSRLRIFGFGTLTAEDREIRRRLFWSAFTWDKIISLALGRTPTFNAHQNVSPGPMVDDTEDENIWRPHFWRGLTPAEMAVYPEHKSWVTLNFRHFIQLCEIIQTIIMRLYVGRPKHAGTGRFIQAMRARLLDWFHRLPRAIKVETSTLPPHCPPPHIFATNALYRAAWILLYRIFVPNTLPAPTGAPVDIMSEASGTCTAMAEELHQLFELYAKSFQLRNMTFTLTWSMYSAATINAMDFQSSDPAMSAAAAPRLGMSLHVLGQSLASTPGTKKSIDIIKHRLRRPPTVSKRNSPDTEAFEERGKRLALSPIQNAAPALCAPVADPLNTASSLTTFLGDAQVTPPFAAPATGDSDEWGTLLNLLAHEANGMPGNVLQAGADTGVDLLQGLLAMPSNGHPSNDSWDSWMQFGNSV